MSYHRLARISQGTDDVADVIHHAGENYMQAQDPQVNLKHSFIIYFFEFIVQRHLMWNELTVQHVALSLELLSGIHAS